MQNTLPRRELIRTKDYMRYASDDRYCAYGNFLDRFVECGNTGRQWIIMDRPDDDDTLPIDAAKLAATVEVLVKKYDLEMPNWVMDPRYILKEPYYGSATSKEFQRVLKETAPPEFARRNVFLGDNCMSRA